MRDWLTTRIGGVFVDRRRRLTATALEQHRRDPRRRRAAAAAHEILGKLLLIDLLRHGLDRVRHQWSFPAKRSRSACRARTSYTALRTLPR